MTLSEVMKELEGYADISTKKTLMKHGAKEPIFGVKVADLKKILKKTKKDHKLSLDLYATGNTDAMYLAGLMADEKKITEDDLNEWVKNAYWMYLSDFAVPWVAAETSFGFELGLKWIASKDENTASAGWGALASYAGVNEDSKLDIQKFKSLLKQVESEIHSSPDKVKQSMNRFVIAVGSFIKDLYEDSINVANNIGVIDADLNGTNCKLPLAVTYLQKVKDQNRLGKKRKSARC
ncbi:MAG: DNA alkylation repair protein [Candidatus Kapabacteria bacterium]|nr:DNA alkylation repair protein [Candidatus Kapabacteria bacterium]